MADEGFMIQDLYGVHLNMPPFLSANSQMAHIMAASDVFLTRKIARLRVHVERAIGRIKEFRIIYYEVKSLHRCGTVLIM